MSRIRIETPAEAPRSYDVLIEPGALAALPEVVAQVSPARRCAV